MSDMKRPDFFEFHESPDLKKQIEEAKKCNNCGVPFCQAGTLIAGMTSGCPLNNLVPETNSLVSQGNFKQAYIRLSKTHSFPEFTSRVCPALCEAACTCGLHTSPIPTKENERAIIDYAFENDLVKEVKPATRTGKKIAIIGSGPSGLAAAQLLNMRGHSVTVYERSDRPGGLLRYGIPNMKLDKRVLDRRIGLLTDAGVTFKCSVDVGKDVKAKELLKEYDRVILCCGASNPRDIKAPGRDAKRIYFAVDFLKEVSKKLMDLNYDNDALVKSKDFSFKSLDGKSVVVIGGGDTGNDCVGTAVRLGAGAVTQLEMMPKPPECRACTNPWPEWPKVLKTDYGQLDAIKAFGQDPRIFETTVKEFVKGKDGNVSSVKTVKLSFEKDPATGRNVMKEVAGSEAEIKADIVLIAAGFLGAQSYIVSDFGVECNERTNVSTEGNDFKTSVDRVFSAGDMRRGQSLVVWAISEGRKVAAKVDESLMGYTNL